MAYIIIPELNEEYPQSFNFEEFKNLTSFRARKEYCDRHLSKISSGSGRLVYKIDDEKVLKLAKNQKGIAQNEVEHTYSEDYLAQDALAKVFDVHEDYLWIEMELARKLTMPLFKKLTGVTFNDYASVLADNRASRGYNPSQELIDEVWEIEDLETIIRYAGDFDIPVGDLTRTSSYGVVERDGHETIVLVDYGLNNDTLEKYYS